MNLKIIILICVAMATQFESTESAKILALFTTHSKSHLIIHMAVTRALVERGHDVTVVTTVDLNDSNPKYRHIKVPGADLHDIIPKMMKLSPFEKFLSFFTVFNKMMANGKIALESPEMQKFLNEKPKFDLVLLGYFWNDFEFGIAAHFECPIALIWMIRPMHPINVLIGNSDEISHVPNLMWGSKSITSLLGRVKNTLLGGFDRLMAWNVQRLANQYYLELFPPDKYPSLDDVKKNISIVLCNHHFSQGPITSKVPGIIEIGGIAIDEVPKPLPEDIQKHLDDAKKDGAIYFSLGSNVQSTYLEGNVTKTIFNVLSSLKQNVIWKWESDDVPGKSKNILYKKWFPQNSILAHPNMKLFITHGGGGSVVESQYHGVPMIGMPIFGDQPLNVETMASEGYGLSLDIRSLNEKTMKETINEVLSNSKYSENVKNYRKLYTDRPMKPKDVAVYWIEYVIRHKGAKHMQSPAVFLSEYQILGLDVIAFILLVLYVAFKITKFMLKFVWSKLCGCCGSRGAQRKSGENENKKKLKTKKDK